MNRLFLIFIILVLIGLSGFAQAQGDTAITSHYQITGRSKLVMVQPNQTFSTKIKYSGLVQIDVSGFVQQFELTGITADSFWIFSNFIQAGTDILLMNGQGIRQSVIFYDGVGNVPPGNFPPYHSNHQYSMVVDLGPGKQILSFMIGSPGQTIFSYGQINVVISSVKKKDAANLPSS